jgi:hypothetical protein
MTISAKQLSPILFWDVAPESLDWERHRVWLMQRVLERGTWEDWQLISAEVSIDELRAMEPALKLAPRERNFLLKWIENYDAN